MIPDRLRALARWAVWRYVLRYNFVKATGKRKYYWAKIAYTPGTRRKAATDDPFGWRTFGEAVAAYQKGGWDGIGILLVFEDGHTGGDLDDCVGPEEGEVTEYAHKVVTAVDTYTEVSPSGTGLRFFAVGCKPSHKDHRDAKLGLELYDGRKKNGESGGRFLAVTGHHFAGTPQDVQERTEAIAALYVETFGPADNRPAPTPVAAEQATEDDDVIVGRLRHRYGDEFISLYDRAEVPAGLSASEAAGRLVHRIATETKNPEQIERIVRTSPGYALWPEDKWDRRIEEEVKDAITNAGAQEHHQGRQQFGR
jgi:primase-polymerase (primpol)-like protein